MVKYICDRCGVCPSDDNGSIHHTYNINFVSTKNGYPYVARSFDLCNKCANESAALTIALSKEFGRLISVFLERETIL
ncbi:hypothetical protein LCGC14_2495810 [marine sediment metagenome]|uniref:Uncharacterized protein n=1 Tax=marine sediment metagenome TaxID=412755 RepID=A0A0F9BRB3_9ZZZZ